MIEKIKQWRTWGEFHNYPKCCVESFVLQSEEPYYMKDSPFYNSSFTPCKTCHELTKDVDYKTANNLLGISVDNRVLCNDNFIKETIDEVNTKRFLVIAERNNFNVEAYLKYLKENI